MLPLTTYNSMFLQIVTGTESCRSGDMQYPETKKDSSVGVITVTRRVYTANAEQLAPCQSARHKSVIAVSWWLYTNSLWHVKLHPLVAACCSCWLYLKLLVLLALLP